MQMQGKVVMVTGGASGIGLATARLLAAEGASVVATDLPQRAPDAAEAVPEALFVSQDVTQEGDWERAMAAVADRFGRLDGLVNNAGVASDPTKLEDLTLDGWRRVLAVNLDGVFLGLKHGIRAMKARGGSIVNLSSILGIVASPITSSYGASKGAVRSLTKAAALECAHLGYAIRVNSVHPGYIDTPMVQGAIQRRADRTRALIESLHPVGRLGRAEEIAAGIAFLLSDRASFMTGSELVIDGGYTAR